MKNVNTKQKDRERRENTLLSKKKEKTDKETLQSKKSTPKLELNITKTLSKTKMFVFFKAKT